MCFVVFVDEICMHPLKLNIAVYLQFTGNGGSSSWRHVLKYLLVQVSSLWLCNTNSSKLLVTSLCHVVLVLYHLNSVVSVVHGPLYCNTMDFMLVLAFESVSPGDATVFVE
jgi:hypothetical protein